MIQKTSINLTRLCQTLLRQTLRFEDQGLWIFDDEMLWIFQWRHFSTWKFVEIGDGVFLVWPKTPGHIRCIWKIWAIMKWYYTFIRITSRSNCFKGQLKSEDVTIYNIIFVELTKKSGVLGFSKVLLRNLRFLFGQAQSWWGENSYYLTIHSANWSLEF